MHRSGTSLLGGILHRLGVRLPGETIAGDQHNPDGYFEWNAIVALQERLLIDLHRWWPSADGCLPLPNDWLTQPASRDAYAHLRQLLLSVVSDQHGPWAIKDPRCSRLLPLWIQLCDELSIPLRLLLAVRDPAEVVTSLVRRDGPLVGMDSSRAQKLWLRHNYDVLDAAHSSSLPLSVIDFGCWFTEPEEQLSKLEFALPELCFSSSQRDQALALVNPQHRRSLSSSDVPKLKRSVRRFYRRLLAKPLLSSCPPDLFFASTNSMCKSLPGVQHDRPEYWSSWLNQHRNFPAPRFTDVVSFSQKLKVSVCGLTWFELRPHLLMQRLPFHHLDNYRFDFDVSSSHQLELSYVGEDTLQASGLLERITLNLELPEPERSSHWLSHLQTQQLIFDPEPDRVLLLRALGLPAWWLDPCGTVNGWLHHSQAVDSRQWASILGLIPPPDGQLLVLGNAGSVFERALSQEMVSYESQKLDQSIPDIAYFPGWPDLVVNDPASGLLRAGWLQAAVQRAARLVSAGVDHCPKEWQLLYTATPCLANPLDSPPSELRARHAGQSLMAMAEDRPTPPLQTLFDWQTSDAALQQPIAAVLVSLFNYQDRIIEALQSVKVQTQQRLELIVVDDASSDEGAAAVKCWMDACLSSGCHPFVRLLLLRHCHNAGLAVARNTAMSQSQSPWCFVLDADNALFPDAVADCLALADASDPQLAVVHPLLAVEAEPGRPDEQRTLVRPQSWQRERLRFENHVDAMALVRRSAWKAVGGYTHIEGGWEDYDFWCKLAGAGYHGLQCPRILAVYRSHASSMSHCATNRSWHALSRTLQQRHPWLQLPLAQTEAP